MNYAPPRTTVHYPDSDGQPMAESDFQSEPLIYAVDAFLGVREYFQYDPTGDYLIPPLQGLRLHDQNYEPLLAQTLRDGTPLLGSEVLGLDLRLINSELRFFDARTGRMLLSRAESERARREAEAEVERLRAELARLRGEK